MENKREDIYIADYESDSHPGSPFCNSGFPSSVASVWSQEPSLWGQFQLPFLAQDDCLLEARMEKMA